MALIGHLKRDSKVVFNTEDGSFGNETIFLLLLLTTVSGTSLAIQLGVVISTLICPYHCEF